MKKEMTAIIRKDLRGISENKRMFAALLAVPLALTVFVPTIFVLVLHFAPDESQEFQRMLALIPLADQADTFERSVLKVVLNYILPVFFLIIPIMAASVTAASSFVGEKEKHTLETLVYCPLSLKQIFRAKVLASFLLSMAVSFLSFAAMLLVFETELCFLAGGPLLPDLKWLVVMLLVSPAISMIAITLIVRISAKAKSVEDAQQGAIFLLLPVLLLIVGQFTGLLLINAFILLVFGILCALAAWLLLKKAMGRFSYEAILK